MSINTKAYIAGVGMITPVGANATMSAASVRAGINVYQETDLFDEDYEPIKMALVPDDALVLELENQSIESNTARDVRLLQLAGTAILELVPLLPPREQKVPVFMAGPEPSLDNQSSLGSSFLRDLAVVSGINIDTENSRCTSIGRAGGLDAINTALKYLEASQQPYVIVGGVDTFYDLDVIAQYLNDGRILTANSMDGFVPGEAAAFVLLRAVGVGDGDGNAAVCLFEPGVSGEPGHLFSEEPYRGDGLASTFSQALIGASSTSVTRIYSSMNGESYFAKELGVAFLRNKYYLRDECITLHPSDCFGDVGAAVGIVLLGLAIMDIEIDKNSDSYLIYGSSDSEYRSAIRIAQSRKITQ